ncbi:hypothetical protein Acr_21g0001000 [Actinidia rufa]|uniref:Uncharacterized protein n=1 Tax=Actinidia rufa TaxID=165716 RepID=A0A7J0GFG4_9ERIC|nr:hypothetical protein Acr_21g0001000 [Actinidia rufa]
MSESEKERPDDVDGGVDVDRPVRRENRQKKNRRGNGFEGNRRKTKWVWPIRLKKDEKLIHRRREKADNDSSSNLGKRVFCGGGGYSCCFKQTSTLNSPVEPQTSDPNSPEFTHELLRGLIEENDFYSKECNPH